MDNEKEKDSMNRPALVRTGQGPFYINPAQVAAVGSGGGAGLGKCAVILNNGTVLALEATAQKVSEDLWPGINPDGAGPAAKIGPGGGVILGDGGRAA